MKLSELKKKPFKAFLDKIGYMYFGRRVVVLGPLSTLGEYAMVDSEDLFHREIDYLIRRFGDVQAGTSHTLGRTSIVPNCAQYNAMFTDNALESFRKSINQAKATD